MPLIRPLVPRFVTEDRSVEEVYGLPLPSERSIDLFRSPFSVPGSPFSSTLIQFDHAVAGDVGLQLDLQRPGLGELNIDYAVETKLELPDVVAASEVFRVGTTSDFASIAPGLSAESLNYGELGLDFLFGLNPGGISNISFLNAFGGSAVTLDQNISFPGIPVDEYRFLTVTPGLGVERELLDGVNLIAALPSGDEESVTGLSRGNVGELEDLELVIDEPLVQIEFSLLEMISEVPQLAPLDFLQEDASILFGEFGAEFEYILAAIKAVAGYGIVQTYTFDPGDVSVTLDIGGEKRTGRLGETFSFTAPAALTEPLKGTVSYQLGGTLGTKIELAPIGSIGVEALGLSARLERGGVGLVDAAVGPLLDVDLSGSSSVGRVTLFDQTLSVGPELFAPVTFDFVLNNTIGQDLAFVIDTTGSMSDDIARVKAAASSIIEAVFDEGSGLANSRVAIAGYKDPGETTTILPFTDQADLDERQSAALSAINSITVSGGGDIPEGVYSGLLHALSGSLGDWRDEATTRRIVLFGDAPPKDDYLADQVRSLAADLGTDISVGAIATSPLTATSSVYRTTVDVALGDAAAASSAAAVPVEIFTVVVGSSSAARSSFGEIAAENAGRAFTAADASEVVEVILEAVRSPPIVADGDPLFDGAFYLDRYVDVADAGLDPGEHYRTFGWREGRDPNALFDSDGYLSANPDVRAAGINPLEHFRASGWREDRDPSTGFDLRSYLTANPDVAAAGLNPLGHYLAFGEAEGRPIAPATGLLAGLFDRQYYLLNNPDVGLSGVDPVLHYLANGIGEGRNPNALFDVSGYLRNYPDVREAGIDPLTHYRTSGALEGRDPSAGFDTSAYNFAYPDVAAAGLNPLAHYLEHGIFEGRSSFGDGVWG